MRKKIVAILLIATMAMGIAACGGSGDKKDDNTITVWCWDKTFNIFAMEEYEKFRKVYQKRDKVKMYLAHGYKKRHCYDSETMETQEYKMGEHDGVLLIYELPDTVKEKKTEAEAYAAVWDIMMELQKELPNSVVYYGQDFLQEEGKRFDEMGVFLPLEHFSDRLERHIEKADQIVYGK